MLRPALALGLLTAVALAAALISVAGTGADPVSAGNGAMEAMSVDVDTTGNTATALGQRDECIEVEAGSDVMIDVTALDIPASNAMVGFQFYLAYDADHLSITSANHDFLLLSAPGGNLLDAADPTPDTDGSFNVSEVDLNTDPSSLESGSGVLSRLTVSLDAETPNGGHTLILSEAYHVDGNDTYNEPTNLFHGQLAVGVTCDSLPPPGPAFAQGDVDCDGDVDAVDALQILRDVAGLGANQQQGCPPIGVAAVQPASATSFGDVDCDGDVDAVDALQILRHVAGLGANQQQGCTPVGE